jgi:hypothetical protein
VAKINRKCALAGGLALALVIVMSGLVAEAARADHPDANIGGGFALLIVLAGVAYYGLTGLREARARHERGAGVAVVSIALGVLWIPAVAIAGLFIG